MGARNEKASFQMELCDFGHQPVGNHAFIERIVWARNHKNGVAGKVLSDLFLQHMLVLSVKYLDFYWFTCKYFYINNITRGQWPFRSAGTIEINDFSVFTYKNQKNALIIDMLASPQSWSWVK